MNTAQADPKAIFFAAMEITDSAARRAFLVDACANDDALRQRIESLLQAHDSAGSFLYPSRTADFASTSESPGMTIGPYKLLQRLGEGGMGTVWMADQSRPVQRTVALKIIKPGMDSRQVLARFEAERQALALMDHPNIAKVLDGGATESNRPYFVMEFVKGAPITRYSDEHRLTPKERLELFVPVCHAIQHAHQKGIIHRDIKPSNILVANYDGKPIVKVIDFGVAKATGQRLTEHTLFTEFGQIVGTLEYMSPEQAELNNQDIDTRSDIYSLGVLLFELLTGSTPLDRARHKQVAFTEMLRIIREQDPPKPSTRLSDSADSLPSISAQRHMEPAKLTKLVRGELDWIVMKCLEKDRSRRYETANGFAMDVQRYLADEPVHACPPSAVYMMRKFARRNKTALTVAGLVVAFLMILGGGIGWTAGERAARRTTIDAELQLALNEVFQLKEQRRYPEAASAARRAEGRSTDGASLEVQVRAREARKNMEMIERLEDIRLTEGTHGEIDTFGFADVDRAYIQTFRNYGIDVDRLSPTDVVARIKSSGIRVELAAALDDWAKACWSSRGECDPSWRTWFSIARQADPDKWRDQLRDVYERWYSRQPIAKAFEQLADSAPIEQLPPSTLALIGQAMIDAGLTEHAANFLVKAQRLNPSDFWINFYLGYCYGSPKLSQPNEAIRFYSAALVVRPRSSAVHNNLGLAFAQNGLLNEAIAVYRDAIRFKPTNTKPYINLANALKATGRMDEAIVEYRAAIRLKPDDPNWRARFAMTLMANKQVDEAIVEYREAIRLKPDGLEFHYGLCDALVQQGKLDEAFAASQQAHQLNLGGPTDPTKLLDLATALYEKGKKTQARQLQEQQIAYLRTTLQSYPETPGHRHWLRDNYWVLADNADLKHDELAKVAEEFPRLFPDEQDEHVRAAWYLCRCAREVHKNDAIPANERSRLAESYAVRAVKMLRQSIAKGNKDVNRLKSEPIFEPLRSRADFQKLVAELEGKPA